MEADDGRVTMYRFCSTGFLTDCVLLSGDGVKFEAHRIVLAASSAYFYRLFQIQSKANGFVNEVNLPLLTGRALSKCLEFIYVCSSSIEDVDIDDFLRAATFLQIHRAIRFGEAQLMSALSSENLDSIYILADRYSLLETVAFVKRYIELSLPKLAKNDSNLKRISAAQMLDVVKSERITFSETELLAIVRKWLETTQQNQNREVVRKLLNEMRLMLIEHDDLVSLLPVAFDLSTPPESDVISFNKVYEALNYLMKPHLQPTVKSKQNRLRAKRLVTLRIAGKTLLPNFEEEIQDEILAINCHDPTDVRMLETMVPPEGGILNHAAVAMDNFVYVLGGLDGMDGRTVFRWDVRTSRWWRAPSMNERRAYFAAAVIDNKIFVAGGKFLFSAATKTSEVYNPVTNSWAYIASLPNEFSGNAGCVGIDGLFYVCGGWKGDDTTGNICADALRYDPSCDCWMQLPDMHHARAFHTIAAVNGRIFVFGGIDHRKRPIAFGEFFDIEKNQWFETPPTPTMHNEGSCFLVYSRLEDGQPALPIGICVCGGYDAENKPQSMISFYDLNDGAWRSWHCQSTYFQCAGSAFVQVEIPVTSC